MTLEAICFLFLNSKPDGLGNGLIFFFLCPGFLLPELFSLPCLLLFCVEGLLS